MAGLASSSARAARADDLLMSRWMRANVATYRRATTHGTAVELTEDLSAMGRYWSGLRAWWP